MEAEEVPFMMRQISPSKQDILLSENLVQSSPGKNYRPTSIIMPIKTSSFSIIDESCIYNRECPNRQSQEQQPINPDIKRTKHSKHLHKEKMLNEVVRSVKKTTLNLNQIPGDKFNKVNRLDGNNNTRSKLSESQDRVFEEAQNNNLQRQKKKKRCNELQSFSISPPNSMLLGLSATGGHRVGSQQSIPNGRFKHIFSNLTSGTMDMKLRLENPGYSAQEHHNRNLESNKFIQSQKLFQNGNLLMLAMKSSTQQFSKEPKSDKLLEVAKPSNYANNQIKESNFSAIQTAKNHKLNPSTLLPSFKSGGKESRQTLYISPKTRQTKKKNNVFLETPGSSHPQSQLLHSTKKQQKSLRLNQTDSLNIKAGSGDHQDGYSQYSSEKEHDSNKNEMKVKEDDDFFYEFNLNKDRDSDTIISSEHKHNINFQSDVPFFGTISKGNGLRRSTQNTNSTIVNRQINQRKILENPKIQTKADYLELKQVHTVKELVAVQKIHENIVNDQSEQIMMFPSSSENIFSHVLANSLSPRSAIITQVQPQKETTDQLQNQRMPINGRSIGLLSSQQTETLAVQGNHGNGITEEMRKALNDREDSFNFNYSFDIQIADNQHYFEHEFSPTDRLLIPQQQDKNRNLDLNLQDSMERIDTAEVSFIRDSLLLQKPNDESIRTPLQHTSRKGLRMKGTSEQVMNEHLPQSPTSAQLSSHHNPFNSMKPQAYKTTLNHKTSKNKTTLLKQHDDITTMNDTVIQVQQHQQQEKDGISNVVSESAAYTMDRYESTQAEKSLQLVRKNSQQISSSARHANIVKRGDIRDVSRMVMMEIGSASAGHWKKSSQTGLSLMLGKIDQIQREAALVSQPTNVTPKKAEARSSGGVTLGIGKNLTLKAADDGERQENVRSRRRQYEPNGSLHSLNRGVQVRDQGSFVVIDSFRVENEVNQLNEKEIHSSLLPEVQNKDLCEIGLPNWERRSKPKISKSSQQKLFEIKRAQHDRQSRIIAQYKSVLNQEASLLQSEKSRIVKGTRKQLNNQIGTNMEQHQSMKNLKNFNSSASKRVFEQNGLMDDDIQVKVNQKQTKQSIDFKISQRGPHIQSKNQALSEASIDSSGLRPSEMCADNGSFSNNTKPPLRSSITAQNQELFNQSAALSEASNGFASFRSFYEVQSSQVSQQEKQNPDYVKHNNLIAPKPDSERQHEANQSLLQSNGATLDQILNARVGGQESKECDLDPRDLTPNTNIQKQRSIQQQLTSPSKQTSNLTDLIKQKQLTTQENSPNKKSVKSRETLKQQISFSEEPESLRISQKKKEASPREGEPRIDEKVYEQRPSSFFDVFKGAYNHFFGDSPTEEKLNQENSNNYNQEADPTKVIKTPSLRKTFSHKPLDQNQTNALSFVDQTVNQLNKQGKATNQQMGSEQSQSPISDGQNNNNNNQNMIKTIFSPMKQSFSQPQTVSPKFGNHSNQSQELSNGEKNPGSSQIIALAAKRNNQNSGGSTSTNDISTHVRTATPLSPMQAIDQWDDILTSFEKNEISTYDHIYEIGSVRVFKQKDVQKRNMDYYVRSGEQIGYRYIVDSVIDAGAFGQVVKCLDKKECKFVALKISKCNKRDTDNAKFEVKMLTKILGKDPDRHNIVRMYDSFYFRQFFIIVFELLDCNLYKYIKEPGFRGMDKNLLREIATQMLHALNHLSRLRITHCDLKPENVVFTDQQRRAVKLIDFGSSCTDSTNGFSYVQSRFYRSPEVVLGLPYNQQVDMWSFGCILAEMVTGRPLFPAMDENELMEFIHVRIGKPPDEMIERCQKRRQFYDMNKKLIKSRRSRIPANFPDRGEDIKKALYAEKDDDFLDFIEQCLQIDPQKRLTPEMALKHHWISRSNAQSMFKGDLMISQTELLTDIVDLIEPLPTKRDERQRTFNQFKQLINQVYPESQGQQSAAYQNKK